MMVRIFEARAAIEQRLLCPIEEDSVEHGELLAAQKALEILKSERVDKPTLYIRRRVLRHPNRLLQLDLFHFGGQLLIHLPVSGNA